MGFVKSWLPIPKSSHFSLANLPFGIITSPSKDQLRPAVAVGDHVLDLQTFAAGGGFDGIAIDTSVFSTPTLNAFAGLGRPAHWVVRKYLQEVLAQDTPHPMVLRDNTQLRETS